VHITRVNLTVRRLLESGIVTYKIVCIEKTSLLYCRSVTEGCDRRFLQSELFIEGRVNLSLLCVPHSSSTVSSYIPDWPRQGGRCLWICNDSICNTKVKVKLSLCLTKHHAMKAYWGSGGIAPLIL
jgi:hypothetical protein